jgi:hypothetical protein
MLMFLPLPEDGSMPKHVTFKIKNCITTTPVILILLLLDGKITHCQFNTAGWKHTVLRFILLTFLGIRLARSILMYEGMILAILSL